MTLKDIITIAAIKRVIAPISIERIIAGEAIHHIIVGGQAVHLIIKLWALYDQSLTIKSIDIPDGAVSKFEIFNPVKGRGVPISDGDLVTIITDVNEEVVAIAGQRDIGSRNAVSQHDLVIRRVNCTSVTIAIVCDDILAIAEVEHIGVIRESATCNGVVTGATYEGMRTCLCGR